MRIKPLNGIVRVFDYEEEEDMNYVDVYENEMQFLLFRGFDESNAASDVVSCSDMTQDLHNMENYLEANICIV